MKFLSKSPFSFGLVFLVIDWILLFSIKAFYFVAQIAHDHELFIYNKDGSYDPYILILLDKLLEVWYRFHSQFIDFLQFTYYSFSNLKVIEVTERLFIFDLLSAIQSFAIGVFVGFIYKTINKRKNK